MSEELPRILIVDDEPTNVKVLAGFLMREYKVMVATEGAKALQAAHSANPPRVILLDVMMPGMDGYEVCRRLKEDPKTRAIPVIFVTALGGNEDEAKGLGLGAADYIAKPFQPGLVKLRVDNQFRLLRAEEDLLHESRLQGVLEMAGAAAHEFSQPLQTMMGESGFLRGALPEDDEEVARSLDALDAALERLGQVVHKVQRITRYETTAYVGKSRIVDLDRSVE